MSCRRYEQLSGERFPFLDRAREAAKLTLPLVIRANESDNADTDYEQPYQSVGSRGTTNLCSNLLLSLFPSNLPFFRLLVSDSDFDVFGDKKALIKQEVEDSLSNIETRVLEEIEALNLRPSIFDALKNLIIAGNALVYVQPDGNIRVYSIEDYVVHRDVEGNLIEIALREIISPTVLKNMDITLPSEMELGSDSTKNSIELFTRVELQDDGTYRVWQEIQEQEISDTESIFPKGELPFLALRLSKVTGESFGRGYVEGVMGDLRSLEALQKALVEAAAISAKTVFMVDPASPTRPKDLSSARNGDVISGRATDVTILRTDKGADLGTAFQASNLIEKRLSYSFNLLEASLPSNPVTTATEINAIVNSLEKILAGTYAMLASEFMSPMVKLIITRLSAENKIPQVPDKVKLIISTGLTALGRNADIERIMQFGQLASQLAPEAYASSIDQRKLLKQLQMAVGVDLLKSDEQIVAEQQQAMLAQQEAMEQEALMLDNDQKRQSVGRIAEKVVPNMVGERQ